MSEAQTLAERLRELRESSIKSMNGVDARGLNWKPTRRDTNSLFVLATHLLGSERGWIHQVIGQRAVKRDRAAEFRAQGSSIDALRNAFDEVARTSDEILLALTPADMEEERQGNYGQRSVRWCILHVIEHYAEHVGQMNLTRQLWEGQAKGKKDKTKGRKPKAKMPNRER